MSMDEEREVASTGLEEENPATEHSWLLIFFGLGLIGYFVLWPIWQVQHHAQEIDYQAELGFGGILILFIGIFRVLSPRGASALLKMDTSNFQLKDVIFLILTGLFAIASGIGMNYYFNSMGYH